MFFSFVLLQIALTINSETIEPIYVKGSAIDDSGTGTKDSPVKTLNTAYTKFDGKESDAVYTIKIIKTDDPQLAESITFNKQIGVKVVGVYIKEADNSEEEAEVQLDCKIQVTEDLIKCRETVELSKIVFIFTFSLASAETTETLSLIAAEDESNLLKITSCKFKRPDTIPADSMAKIHLINVKAGELQMSEVQCSDENNMIMFSVAPFLFEGVSSVSLTSCQFGKITSSASSVMRIKNTNKIQVSLDSCTFTECKSTEAAASATSGALYVESDATDSEFTIGNTGATTFTSCTCENGKSGAIHLNMKKITADKLTWPKTEANLKFITCTVGAAATSKNTSLYLDVKVELHSEFAAAMKASFANGYDRTTHKDYIMAKKTETEDIDLVSEYIDPAPKEVKTFYVKSGATEGDGSDTKPWANIKDAYDHFTEPSEGGFFIEIMKTDGEGGALVAEVNTFDKATGVTIEGYQTDVSNIVKIDINCQTAEGKDMFTCKKAVAFKYLKMTFPLTFDKKGASMSNDGTLALIHADSESTSLAIDTCEFVRAPKETGKDYIANIHVVNVDAGAVSMNDVKCTGAEELTFSVTPFKVEGVTSVSLTLLNIEKLNSKQSAVMKVVGKADEVVTVVIDRCTFSNCISSDESTATSGALHVECENKGSKFSVKDKSATSFSSCSCTKGKSGALYLKMANIEKANQLSWPETKTDDNFKFTTCTAGEGDNEKSTGIYLDVPVALHKDIADTMKAGFATGYVRGTNDWNIVANSEDGDVDFTSKYFNPAIAYVKKDGSGNGETYETPMGSIINAYNGLVAKPSISGYVIKVIKEEDDKKILKAEAVTFEKEVKIVGVKQVQEEGTETKKEVEDIVSLDCDAKNGGDLFTCKNKVEFRGISFLFPLSLDKPKNSNDDPVINSLIVAEGADAKLNIVNCKFVKSKTETSSNDGEETVGIHLVKVSAGTLTMNTVEFKEANEVKFQKSMFVINGASSVKLDKVDIEKVSVVDEAAIIIQDATDKAMNVKIEELTMNEVKSEKGLSAGVKIKMVDSGSNVEMGKDKKCSFKSCVATAGNAGAITIEMKKAVDHLKLPGEGKLELGENKGKDSSVASLCIIAEDFDDFCKKGDSFGFAKDYNDDNKGWIVGAKDEKSDLEDVYEKYLKKEEPKEEPEPEKKKSNAGTIVAIVVPIVVVVIVVVVVIIVIVVVRKKRSRN
ncbi:uncharacterized protein MONOS_13717 [Monocercomonoides exilis]|uniref:uncharacterized protein n=1 Tax=Monocercomonoides exilis TaxID=2049356 RepID=UPI0035593F15|nr:hypothetical protein MONOS_13717 [Monocercomonoides exilis]